MKTLYSKLLSLVYKAYLGEDSIIDEAILDQFICGCEDEKIRLHLLDKNP